MTLKRLRVDNVGSMLRPAALREAFVKFADGGLSEEQLTHEQDEAIRAVIAHQERIGFPIVVDGEFRRTGYLASFADIEGAEDWLSRWTPRRLHREQPVTAGPARGADPVHSDDLRTPATTKLRLKRNRPLEEYTFAAKGRTRRPRSRSSARTASRRCTTWATPTTSTATPTSSWPTS